MGNSKAQVVPADSSSSSSFNRFRGRMIAPKTCADELDNSEFTIHRWIKEGKIEAVKLSSRCTRIVGDSLADLLEAGKVVPGEREPQPEHLRRESPAKVRG